MFGKNWYGVSNLWKNTVDNETSQPQPKSELDLDLNFVPTWARQPAGKNPYAQFEGGGRGGRREERGSRPWGDQRGPRPPRRDGQRGERRGPPAQGGERRGPPPGGDRRGTPSQGGRRFERDRRGEFFDRPVVPPIHVRFIPERNRLGAVVHDLHTSMRAYPLMEVAGGFLGNPAFYLVKAEMRPAGDGKKPQPLFQCKECKVVFLKREAAMAHARGAHLELRFNKETVSTEPPSGNFVCVARCRLSGQLLGPPNHHGYSERVQELWRARFSQMSIDQYRSNIETVRDPELIEKWKQEQTTRTVYKLKDQENPAEMKLAEAEKYFAEHFTEGLVVETQRFIVPPEVVHRFEDAGLKAAVSEAWNRESRKPFSLMLALRPAFNHMRLHLFKAAGRVTFVTAVRPYPIEPGQAVQPIAEVLQFLREHPGCTRKQMVDQLRPDAGDDSAKVAEVISPLRWLIEKGHVIEFFDGTLAVPTAAAKSAPRSS